MDEPVLMGDARVRGIPVVECGEPLVDLAAQGFVRIDPRRADPTGAWHHVRAGVAERLEHAASLLPDGVHLLLVEGYRPPALQERYFAEYRDELGADHPELAAAELLRLTSRFVAPPDLAPHTAGAAVDLTLCRDDGTELAMGTPVNATPEESDGRCYTDAATLDAQARAHRDVLGGALGRAGLVNYPTEWWHWSYGDRYWALLSGTSRACYGPVDAGPGAGPAVSPA